jgi:hypothetical protein
VPWKPSAHGSTPKSARGGELDGRRG